MHSCACSVACLCWKGGPPRPSGGPCQLPGFRDHSVCGELLRPWGCRGERGGQERLGRVYLTLQAEMRAESPARLLPAPRLQVLRARVCVACSGRSRRDQAGRGPPAVCAPPAPPARLAAPTGRAQPSRGSEGQAPAPAGISPSPHVSGSPGRRQQVTPKGL